MKKGKKEGVKNKWLLFLMISCLFTTLGNVTHIIFYSLSGLLFGIVALSFAIKKKS